MTDSGATVVIPGNSMPWKCTVNGVTYTYEAGTEVAESRLPAGVLAEIKAYWAAQRAEETGGGTGGSSGGGVATVILRSSADAEGQNAESGIAVAAAAGPTLTSMPITCDNYTYAQAKAILDAGQPLAVMWQATGWSTSVITDVDEDGYIAMSFFIDGGFTLYWDANGFYRKQSE